MRGFFLVAMVLGAASGAQAADMPDFLRGSLPGGPAPTVNWAGFYVGGQGSYGSSSSNVTPSLNSDLEGNFAPPANFRYNWQPLGQAKNVAAGYGGFAGYNGQWDDVVAGVEANYLHSNYSDLTSAIGNVLDSSQEQVLSSTYSSARVNLTDFGSLRVRAGYVMGCFLPYVFAGMGLGSETIERNVSATPAPMGTPMSSNTKTNLVYGYSGGAGVDVMLAGGFFLRAEYEYQRVTSAIETTINSGRLGLGYKF